QCSGFLPCVLAGSESGFEIYFEAAADVLSGFPNLGVTIGSRDVAMTFRWGGDMSECTCVLIVSAALPKTFRAILHYHYDHMLYSADQPVQEARAALQSL